MFPFVHTIAFIAKLRGPDIFSQDEKPEKVFKQKLMKEMLSMKMGDSEFYGVTARSCL